MRAPAREALVCLALSACAGLAGSLAVAVVKLYPAVERISVIANRVDEASAVLFDCVKVDGRGRRRGNPDCLPSMILAVGGSLRSASGEVTRAMPEITAAAKVASRQSVEASRQATEAAKETTALIREARVTIQEVTGLSKDMRGLIQEAQRSLIRLTNSGDGVLKPLAETMKNIETLTATLEREIKVGSPKAQETFEALTKAILDFDKLLTDENIKKILANVEGSTKSIDDALRPWRERAHLLKIILSKVAGILKVNVVDLF